MKKHLLLLLAVIALALGSVACGSKASSEDSEDSRVSAASKFVDVINDATEEVNSAKSESDIDAIGDDFEAQCKDFKNDDKELSADEKTEIVNALSEHVAAMGCKQAEFEGETIDASTKTLVKQYSKTAVENITKDCKSIKDIIAAFAALS